MATTSLSLGKHWEDFLEAKVAEGRYGSKSEVIRASLRMLEEHDEALEKLRSEIAKGDASPDAGPFDMDAIRTRSHEKMAVKVG